MKAIKIDSENSTIKIIEIDNLVDVYSAIGENCTCFATTTQFDNDDLLVIDDNLIDNPENIRGGFIIENWAYPRQTVHLVVGNAIVLGMNDNKEYISCKSQISEISKNVVFLNPENLNEHKKYLQSNQ
jgi:hypothetical protein